MIVSISTLKSRFQYYVNSNTAKNVMCPIFMSQWHANKDIWQRFLHVHIFYSSFYFLILFNTCALDCMEDFIWQQMSKKKTKQKQPIKIKNLLDLCIFFSCTSKDTFVLQSMCLQGIVVFNAIPTIIINFKKLISSCWIFAKSSSQYLRKSFPLDFQFVLVFISYCLE